MKPYPVSLNLAMGALAMAFCAKAGALVVTPDTNPDDLVAEILGPGVSVVGAPTFSGASGSAGVFSDGLASGIGFEGGVVLTTGQAVDADGPNANTSLPESFGDQTNSGEDASTDNGAPGDPMLDGIVGSGLTNDAAVLAFDFEFTSGIGGDLFFSYVFASDEYINFVGTEFNDVFAFFLDGVNVALLPDTSDPVTINTVNPVSNSDFYINNVPNLDGLPVAGADVAYDGFTTVLPVRVTGLLPGTHRIEFKIADTFDGILDSAVLIQRGTFSSEPPAPIPALQPSTLALVVIALAGLGFARRVRVERGCSVRLAKP